jgi:hypothetical protein
VVTFTEKKKAELSSNHILDEEEDPDIEFFRPELLLPKPQASSPGENKSKEETKMRQGIDYDDYYSLYYYQEHPENKAPTVTKEPSLGETNIETLQILPDEPLDVDDHIKDEEEGTGF